MSEKNLNNKGIGGNTQVNFTIKSFFATIGSILAIFFTFYQLVVIPRIITTEEHYREMFNDQKEQNRIFYEEINKMNNSIGALNTSITSLNQRFRDLNQNLSTQNRGGSFSNDRSSSEVTSEINDELTDNIN